MFNKLVTGTKMYFETAKKVCGNYSFCMAQVNVNVNVNVNINEIYSSIILSTV